MKNASDKLFSRNIPEFKYVVTGPERTHISISKTLKVTLMVYQRHKKIRTLTEAVYRACALGMRYDLMSDDPRLPAVRKIHEMVLQNIRDKRKKTRKSSQSR